jgi:hypothetical protein
MSCALLLWNHLSCSRDGVGEVNEHEFRQKMREELLVAISRALISKIIPTIPGVFDGHVSSRRYDMIPKGYPEVVGGFGPTHSRQGTRATLPHVVYLGGVRIRGVLP